MIGKTSSRFIEQTIIVPATTTTVTRAGHTLLTAYVNGIIFNGAQADTWGTYTAMWGNWTRANTRLYYGNILVGTFGYGNTALISWLYNNGFGYRAGMTPKYVNNNQWRWNFADEDASVRRGISNQYPNESDTTFSATVVVTPAHSETKRFIV